MPLPIPNLDDRRFDDLVAEAKQRLANHLPEMAEISPGDPVHSMVDLFAWMTETILYRANLIPERQRRVFLNLLQVPLRAARPATGLACVDAKGTTIRLPALVTDGSQLRAGEQRFTIRGELQPTPLQMLVGIKEAIPKETLDSLGFTLQDLHEQYGLRLDETPEPFQPRFFEIGKESPSLAQSLDGAFYLGFALPKKLSGNIDGLRDNLKGQVLNIGIAPADDIDGEAIDELPARQLQWHLMSREESGEMRYVPLEVLADSSRGGMQTGVARLRIPNNADLLQSLVAEDPMFSGLGDLPPEPPAPLDGNRMVFWLRLQAKDEPALQLRYIDVNAVDVVGQGLKTDVMLAVGNGLPEQNVQLPDSDVQPQSLRIEVEEDGAWVQWQQREFLLGAGGSARVYSLDAASGTVRFGDGLETGKRPGVGKRIRAALYLHGGGRSGNLPADSIRELDKGEGVVVRQPLPTSGGENAESIDQAEQRIPQYLSHRNRAVTRNDFKALAENNPLTPIARAEVFEGFIPGASIRAARSNVPGAVSVFVLPPGQPRLAANPRPTAGTLKAVYSYLRDRVLVGTELYVLAPEHVPIAIGLRVDVVDPETEQTTHRALREAMIRYLWPLLPGGAEAEGWAMGRAVSARELITVAARVSGIRSVNSFALFAKSGNNWRRLSEDSDVLLNAYQFPELMGISVQSGSGEPSFPEGIGRLEGQPDEPSRRGIPAPLIPDLC